MHFWNTQTLYWWDDITVYMLVCVFVCVFVCWTYLPDVVSSWSVNHCHTAAGSPSLAQAQCLLSPGQIRSRPNCEQWRRGNSRNMPHHCPRQREEIRRINTRASFQRWRSCGLCKEFSAGLVRTCWICFTFQHKTKMAAVTVIPTLAHIADVSGELRSLLLYLAC